MDDILTWSDTEILEEIKRLTSAYQLKRTIRYGVGRDPEVHAESVAEHKFALIYLAYYFLLHESVGPSLNSALVYDTLLFHDFPEIKHGDVVTYRKTKEDEEKEKLAAVEVFGNLPQSMGEDARKLWERFEEHNTPETKFAWALDKLEPIFELFNPVNERTLKRLQITRDMHVGNKFKACQGYPLMLRFLDVMTKEMDKRDVFYKETN